MYYMYLIFEDIVIYRWVLWSVLQTLYTHSLDTDTLPGVRRVRVGRDNHVRKVRKDRDNLVRKVRKDRDNHVRKVRKDRI